MAGFRFSPLVGMGPLFRNSDDLMPKMEATIELPEILEPSNQRLVRTQNRLIKEALKATLATHHKKRIPQHFNKWRQKKYGYAERHPRTVMSKVVRKRDLADLVKTGKTKAKMQAMMQIRAGGSASGGTVNVTGRLRFKEGFRFNSAAQKGVTPQVMKDEISRWTPLEEAQAAMEFRSRYVELMNKQIKGKKIRKRLAGSLSKLGITP